MPLRLLPLLALSLLLLVGCGSQKAFIGGKKTDREVKTVVSLSPGTSELAALTFRRRILGRTSSCDLPPEITRVPVVMTGVKPDFEKIAKIHPDMVLYDPDLFSEGDLAKFKELGIDTFAVGGDTVDQFIDRLYEFGRISNSVDSISTYVDRIYRERESAQVVKATPPVTMAVVLPGSGYEHMIAGTEGIVADIVRSGGGEPVGPAGKRFVTMNAEAFIKLNPELIITAGQPDAVVADPRFKNLRAVKNGKVFGTNASVTLRRGSYMEKFIKRVSELSQIARQVK